MSEMYTHAELKKMKIAELKKLLKDRGLSTSGNKSNLLERLSTAGDTSFSESYDKDILEDDSVLDDSTDIVSEDTEDAINIVESDTKSAFLTEPTASVTVHKPATAVLAKPTSTSTQPQNIRAQQTPSTGMDARLKRFGVVSEQARMAARLERFQPAGSSTTVLTVSGRDSSVASDANVMKKRAERFGTSASGPSTTVVSIPGHDDDVLKKRAQRFGGVTAPQSGTANDQDRALKRKARFGTITVSSDSASIAEQKKRRLERFGTSVAV